MSSDEIERLIRKIILQLARESMAHDAKRDADALSLAEIKAFEARVAEQLAKLDEIRGTTDVSYRAFREAFDAGAQCDVLVELKNGMHPKDPLRNDAIKDLRSVGCFSKSSKRRRR